MTPPNNRSGRSAAPSAAAYAVHAPHAALLIDFDNVTLGIRSDLTKELRTLLNSDIIKGKVAVQRAYADWRRYPQYIYPLSESSIDLIYAVAAGPNKKNATDIRLAVDATELIFTRPEIGTFILLSGDSDFSSLVLKLKEYGKYVIGVGIRESASDLLIQNCDEYFSYSDLAGLTKEVDTPAARWDAWELVREAVAQMARNGDIMRSDRLKQVMQQIDPNFEEKNEGFNRFSKFVTEAANRGHLKVTKLENGQFEVAPVPGGVAPVAPAAAPQARGTEGGEEARRPGARSRGGRGRGRGRERSRPGAERTETKPAVELPPATTALSLADAFHLLTRALRELPPPVGHESLRLRMATLLGREDPLLDSTRFSRLLRQANDAEVADVRNVGEEAYEILPHKADLSLTMAPPPGMAPRLTAQPGSTESKTPTPAPTEPAPRGPALRFRRGSRSPTLHPDVALVGMVKVERDPVPEVTSVAPPEKVEAPSRSPRRRGGRGAPKTASVAVDADSAAPNGAAKAKLVAAAGAARTRTRAKKRPSA